MSLDKIRDDHKAMDATDAGESPLEISVTFAGRVALFVAIVLFASGIRPWSINGIAAIVGVALVAGGGMWWVVTRARRKPPVHQWVATYSAPRWDSPLDAPSTLARDRSGQHFLDNEAVARTDLEDDWTAFALPSSVVTYVRTDVVRQALPEQ